MKYRVTHQTSFSYARAVTAAQHVLRLRPREVLGSQTLGRHDLRFSVPDTETQQSEDYFGNSLLELRLYARHNELTIDSVSEVDVLPRDEILLDLSPRWRTVAESLTIPMNAADWQATQFCFPSRHVHPHASEDYIQSIVTDDMSVLRLAHTLTTQIYKDFTYQGGVTSVNTPVSEIIKHRRGVCQDFAHLAIACLRNLGLAARYVSGYILSELEARPALVGSEASHAWISVYCPEFGWVDFDPTNNQMTSDQHIILGWGRDYADVAPSQGSILGGGRQTLEIDVSVKLTS